MLKISKVAIVFSFIAVSSWAQIDSPVVESVSAKHGVSVAFPAGGGATVGYAYFTDPNTSWRLDVGLSITKVDGVDATAGFSIDAGWRRYFAHVDKVKVFMQPGLFISKTEGGAGTFGEELTFAPNFGIGGEYWLSNNFTLGASTGIALSFANKLKNITFKTGTTAVHANYYW